jgi:transcriptional regulator with XRE-family HTH domain
MERKEHERLKMNRALRDLLLEASEDELQEGIADAGEDLDVLADRGRAAAHLALSEVKAVARVKDLHRGLGALLQMLRQRDHLSIDQVAEKARVDPAELRRIELDPGFDPQPRTIFQLTRYFKLPERSLIVLSGAMRVEDDVREEVVRFAASSENISGLTSEQRKLLNGFVRFLKEHTDG